MLDWILDLLPYQKYAGYILSSYLVGLIILVGIFVVSLRQKKKIIQQLIKKYHRLGNVND